MESKGLLIPLILKEHGKATVDPDEDTGGAPNFAAKAQRTLQLTKSSMLNGPMRMCSLQEWTDRDTTTVVDNQNNEYEKCTKDVHAARVTS